jgi:hypothetical protein
VDAADAVSDYLLSINIVIDTGKFIWPESKRSQAWKQTLCDALQDMAQSLKVLILVSQ